MKQNLLPITSRDPLKIASYLTENVTPLYAFIYATAVCAESLYKKMLELGFERQPSSEEMLALMFDSVKFGYFDIHKALSLVSELEREKRKAIKHIKEKHPKNYIEFESLEFEVPNLMLHEIQFISVENGHIQAHESVGTMANNIKDYVGARVPTWHISMQYEYKTSYLIKWIFYSNAIASSTSYGDVYPPKEVVEKLANKSSSEMFKLFKSSINSAKKFATE